MLEYVSSKCYYGKDPAQDMIIHDTKPSSAYHVSKIYCDKKKKKKKSLAILDQ